MQPITASSCYDTIQILSNLLAKYGFWISGGIEEEKYCKEYVIVKTNFPACYIQGFDIGIAKYGGYTDSINGCDYFRISMGFSQDNYN